MALDRKAKESLRIKAEGKFAKANGAIVAEYRGLTVAELTELRRNLRKANAEFAIIKNRIARKALELNSELTDSKTIAQDLKGPIGVIYLYGDAAQGAKVALDFEKEKELFKITTGVVGGQKLSPTELKQISELPSKEVLLGQIVGLLVAPHRSLLGVLNAVPRSLVQVINGIKEKKNT